MLSNEQDVKESDPDIHQGRLHVGFIVVMQPWLIKKELHDFVPIMGDFYAV